MTEPLPERAMKRLLAVAASEPAPHGSLPRDLPARYQVVREVGRGGMGVVYEAFDRQLDRRCALKMIGAAGGASDELRRRLAREALAAARLQHPHIAAIYDATPDYISMQLIAGGPIDTIDRGERRLIVELVRDAARALHHAHEQGVVHRDLKPSNLLVEGRRVFVVDFGLAKEIATDASRSVSGVVVGTPAYMPPEQARGRSDAIDARSDVYALGATLHHCLTGAPPFVRADLPSLLRSVVEDEPSSPHVEHDLDLVILKCLAKDPGQRYATARALADDLDRWLECQPVHARLPSIGYRLRKLLQRQRRLLRAAGAAALGAVLLTALVLAPIAMRESAARAAASEAVALSSLVAAELQDASMFTHLGDLPSAHHVLDSGIAQAREFLGRHEVARVRHLLSRLLRARGQPDLALAELEHAIAGDPTLDEARFERGLMLAARWRMVGAPGSPPALTEAERATAIADLSILDRVRSALPSVDCLYGQAERYRLQGDRERAMDALREVLAYDPTHVGARTSLADVALALGDDNLARHYAVSAVDLQLGYGPIYLAREQRTLPTTILGLDAALVNFAPQLAEGPDNAIALAYRALVHLRRALRLEAEGSRAEALAAVQSAIEDHDATLMIHSDLAGALNNRAVCVMQAERFFAAAGDAASAEDARVRAEADLERAAAADPALPEVSFNLGALALRMADVLRESGRTEDAGRCIDRARASLEQAIARAPSDWLHLRACRAKLAQAEAARSSG